MHDSESDSEYVRLLGGLVLPDRTLSRSVPYAESELWAYIRNEARLLKGSNVVYSRMFSPSEEFDEDMARDVVAAVVANRSPDRDLAMNAHRLGTEQLHAFLALVSNS